MILFLFKGGRAARLNPAKLHPTEFFYGYLELAEQGWPVTMLDEEDLGIHPLPLAGRLLGSLGGAIGGLPIAALPSLLRSESLRQLNQATLIVATTNSFGVCAAILKRIGLLHPSIIFLPMGLIKPSAPSFIVRWYRWALRNCKILSISHGERQLLAHTLGADIPVDYLSFGVDEKFWRPGDLGNDGYVLSIGNDHARDYTTLISAWRPEYPPLRIITGLPVPSTPNNVSVIRGDWRTQVLSDEEVRRLYQRALFVVLPIRETPQPSGQSACLQAMACGKAVVLSDIQGLWDRQLMVDGETLLLARPGDSENLRLQIERLLNSPELTEMLGRNARRVVEENLNTRIMATQLSGYAKALLGASS